MVVSPVELPLTVAIFQTHTPRTGSTRLLWLVSAQTVSSVTQERHFYFSLIVINIDVNNHVCLSAAASDSAAQSHVRCCLVAELCPALLRPHGLQPMGSSVPGIFQARILEELPSPSPGDLPDLGINPASPALAGRFTYLICLECSLRYRPEAQVL